MILDQIYWASRRRWRNIRPFGDFLESNGVIVGEIDGLLLKWRLDLVDHMLEEVIFDLVAVEYGC